MNEDAHKKSLTIEMDREAVAACFIQLLTEGVTIEASLDCNLKYLLCDQIGMAPDYLEKRLQTVFLDGQPVDDVEQTIVGEGSVIALSGRPGLVGAVLRTKAAPLPASARASPIVVTDPTERVVLAGSRSSCST